MADRKRLERIELLIGTGHVFEGPKEIATVHYRIEVFREKIQSPAFSGSKTVDGLIVILGAVNPVGASISVLFNKRALTLVFEDGRKMDFFVSNAIRGTITNASGAGIY